MPLTTGVTEIPRMADSHLTKTCTICKQEKLLTDFYKLKSGGHGVTSMCKRCFCDYTKNKPNPYTPDPNIPTPTKICTTCAQEKPITDFHKSNSGKYGVRGVCKSCYCDYIKNKPNPYMPDPNAPTPIKICTSCQQEKIITDFNKSKHGKYGVSSQCKECLLQKRKETSVTFDPEKYGENITCPVCKESKHYNLFHNSKSSLNGKVTICKDCLSDINSQKNNLPEENYDKKLRLCTTCLKEKLGTEFRKSKNGRGGLSSQCKKCQAKYKNNNRHKYNANNARRNAIKLNATPKWFDKQKVDAIYEECSKISKEAGVEHHVDHIVPLISKHVCGLHSIENLQIIPGSENGAKGNRRWPNMPDKKDRSVAATKENLAKLVKS